MAKTDLFDISPKVRKRRINALPENPEISAAGKAVGLGRFPSWLHRKLPKGGNTGKTGTILSHHRMPTVCEEAKCPNLPECWSQKTATFLVMGDACTRSCGFCSIDFSRTPKPLESDEPKRVAESVKALGLQHVVITMVARDDVQDGGAEHLSRIIKEIRKQTAEVTIEVLTSDFFGNEQALETMLSVEPEIFNHNIETVRELTPRVRHKATYERTLHVLEYMHSRKNSRMLIKSGFMAGFGETEAQGRQAILDLYEAGCRIITIGQYLQSDRRKLLVKEFVTPEQFKRYEDYGSSIGVDYMFCGPFIRSSYNAREVYKKVNER
ncbi:MAG: lipoyl synthase [Waddliaceae bacterium]